MSGQPQKLSHRYESSAANGRKPLQLDLPPDDQSRGYIIPNSSSTKKSFMYYPQQAPDSLDSKNSANAMNMQLPLSVSSYSRMSGNQPNSKFIHVQEQLSVSNNLQSLNTINSASSARHQ